MVSNARRRHEVSGVLGKNHALRVGGDFFNGFLVFTAVAKTRLKGKGRIMKTAKEAKREAESRRQNGDGLNALGGQSEWAYSPSTFSVGMRDDPEQRFRIVNINYPMYGRAEFVNDWVSVGTEKPKRGRPWSKTFCNSSRHK